MCDKVFTEDTWMFEWIPDHFKTQEMCDKAVAEDDIIEIFNCIPDEFKTQEMCDVNTNALKF